MKRPAIPIDTGVGQFRYGEHGQTRRVDAVFTIDVTRESVLRAGKPDWFYRWSGTATSTDGAALWLTLGKRVHMVVGERFGDCLVTDIRQSEVDDAMDAVFVGEGHLYGFEWPEG